MAAPDLVSRMVDARDCLRDASVTHEGGQGGMRAVAGALRWLEEGIAEGEEWRARVAAARELVAGEAHVCTCAQPHVIDAAGVPCPTCGAKRHADCMEGGRRLDEAHPARAMVAVREAEGCSNGFDDRCRFEAALRELVA